MNCIQFLITAWNQKITPLHNLMRGGNMLNIRFFLDDDDEIITGFELGGIEIASTENYYILRDKNYYFMVFLSIVDLLDSIGTFYKMKKEKTRIHCADSSFYIDINRLTDNKISVNVLDISIGVFDELDFVAKMHEACNNFNAIYKNKFDENNHILRDIKSAMDSLLPIFI